MNMKLPLSQKQFFDLVNMSETQNTLKFLQRANSYLQNPQVQLIDSKIDPFKLDNSDREQRFLEAKQSYYNILIDMKFTEMQVKFSLDQYSLKTHHVIPPFSEILTQVINAPRLRTLTEIDFQNVNHEISPQQFILTDLQKLIFDHATQFPINGIFVLATGFGKTVLAAFLLQNSFTPTSKVLFLVNSVFIKQQASKTFQQLLNTTCFDFDPQTEQTLPKTAQIVFSTFQSALKLPEEFLSNLTHLIIDEAHHVLAPTFLSVFRRLKHTASFVAGFTATLTHLSDPDGTKITNEFSNQLYCNLPWFVAKKLGLFPPVRYVEILRYPGFKLQRIPGYEKLKCNQNLQIFLRQIQIQIEFPVQQLATTLAVIFAQFGIRSHCIVFLGSVSDCDEFSRVFNQIQDFSECKSVHYKTKNAADVIQEFKMREKMVIATVGMATEGFDLPQVDCVFLGRKTQSERVFVQQMGRGLRKCKEKQDFLVIDCVGAVRDRWVRLREENSEQAVQEAVDEFWEVESYI